MALFTCINGSKRANCWRYFSELFTIAAITGGIAEAYYGIPDEIKEIAMTYYLDQRMKNILSEFKDRI